MRVYYSVRDDKFKTSIYCFLIGRDPLTSNLGLEKASVKVNPKTNYIIGVNNEQTSMPHIYAIGDVLQVTMG